jgi:hypothetical protein
MKTIVCKNGVELTYDETIKVGDIITTYSPGFHELTEIEDRGAFKTPLFIYKRVFNDAGEPYKKTLQRITSCDASYCRKATEEIPKIIAEKKKSIEALQKILNA